MNFNKILVPVDFSEYSDRAVEYALFLAENYGSEVTLLHSVVLLQEESHEKENLEAFERMA